MKLKIASSLFEFLKESLLKERIGLFEKLSFTMKDNLVFIELNQDTAIDIGDWAGEKLQSVGFDEDYELNEEGKKLESIIDLFYE